MTSPESGGLVRRCVRNLFSQVTAPIRDGYIPCVPFPSGEGIEISRGAAPLWNSPLAADTAVPFAPASPSPLLGESRGGPFRGRAGPHPGGTGHWCQQTATLPRITVRCVLTQYISFTRSGRTGYHGARGNALTSSLIAEQLKQLPAGPGVYLMRDSEGRILYVGKAADLSQRVRSYFAGVPNLPLKLRRLVERIHDIDYYVTNLEQEALILELNLIKRHRPLFNVRLKDDKSFPFLKVSLQDEWPRVYFTRLVDEDGSRYFGPFASARSVRQTIQALQRIFPFRSCAKPIRGADPILLRIR